MTCNVYYMGEWAPVMTWTFSRAINVNYNVNNVSTDNYVSSTLSMTATTSLAGVTVSGMTYFNRPQPGEVNSSVFASNVIKYKHVWKADHLTILEGTTVDYNGTDKSGKLIDFVSSQIRLYLKLGRPKQVCVHGYWFVFFR